MSACVKLASGSEYTLDLDLLYPIVKDRSQTKILSTKVGIFHCGKKLQSYNILFMDYQATNIWDFYAYSIVEMIWP